MEKRVTVTLLLLTWVNVGILVVNLVLSIRHEDAVVRSAATVVGAPAVLRYAEPSPERIGGDASANVDSRWDEEDETKEVQVTRLDPEQLTRIVEAAHAEDRARSRTVALLQVLDRMEKRKEVQPLDRKTRDLIVQVGRDAARERAVLERKLALQESPDLQEWQAEMDVLDRELRESAAQRLQDVLTRGELERLLRYLVSPRHTVATLK